MMMMMMMMTTTMMIMMMTTTVMMMMMMMMMISFFPFLRVMEHLWNEIDRGKQKCWGKTCPSAILSTTNPTLTDTVSNPGLESFKSATCKQYS
jgi:hypothetical protein